MATSTTDRTHHLAAKAYKEGIVMRGVQILLQAEKGQARLPSPGAKKPTGKSPKKKAQWPIDPVVVQIDHNYIKKSLAAVDFELNEVFGFAALKPDEKNERQVINSNELSGTLVANAHRLKGSKDHPDVVPADLLYFSDLYVDHAGIYYLDIHILVNYECDNGFATQLLGTISTDSFEIIKLEDPLPSPQEPPLIVQMIRKQGGKLKTRNPPKKKKSDSTSPHNHAETLEGPVYMHDDINRPLSMQDKRRKKENPRFFGIIEKHPRQVKDVAATFQPNAAIHNLFAQEHTMVAANPYTQNNTTFHNHYAQEATVAPANHFAHGTVSFQSQYAQTNMVAAGSQSNASIHSHYAQQANLVATSSYSQHNTAPPNAYTLPIGQRNPVANRMSFNQGQGQAHTMPMAQFPFTEQQDQYEEGDENFDPNNPNFSYGHGYGYQGN